MSDRLRSLRRIVALQAQRKRMAEWNLAALDRRRAEIAEAQHVLGGFVAEAQLAGPLATLALAQARRLAEREAAAARDRARLVGALQAAERRHRLAERIADGVAVEERAAGERRTLEGLIEAALARADADAAVRAVAPPRQPGR